MLRTAKWMGSEAWGLRIVVEALPTLLLISLALFFAALCDLLWSINRPVSIVVVAFTAAGAVFYGFTVIAAAIDTFSPYQTAVSIAIRDVPLGSKKLLQKSRLWISSINSRMVSNLRKRMTRVLNLIKKSLGGVSAIVRRIGEEERADAKKEIDEEESIGAKEEILYAHSLLWMLEHSTTQKDILACIDNIPALPSLHSTWIVARSPLFPTLVEKFEAALTTAVKIKTEVHEQHALALARALAHLVVADPGHCREPAKHILNQATVYGFMSTNGSNRTEDLWALCVALMSFDSDCGTDHEIRDNDMQFRFNGFAERKDTAQKFAAPSCLTLMKLSRFGKYIVLPDLATVYSAQFVGLMCLDIIDYALGHQQPLDQRIRYVWSARTGKNLARHMVKDFEAHDRRIATGFNRKRLLGLHTQLLINHRRSRTSSLRDHTSIPSFTRDLVIHLSNVLQQCFDAPHDDKATDPNTGSTSPPPYAVQLLLYLGSPSLNSQNASYTMEEANIVIKGVIQFQDRMAADENLIHTLHTIGQVLGHSVSAATDLFRSVVPFFLRALHSASTEMVTTAYHVLNNIGDRSCYKESDRTSLTAGKRLEHRMHLLEAMEFNFSVTVTPGNGDANGACREPAVRDTVMRALNFYIVNRLAFIHRDETNVEIFIFIFTFVQHTFLLRPSAALFFELDLASDILIKRVKAWIDDAQDHRSTSNDGLEDPELENLQQCWMGARRAYAGISRTRDVSLRSWKFRLRDFVPELEHYDLYRAGEEGTARFTSF
ncbi:hypothetical protein FRB96_008065 [Tulasnella sp. 330]|nr:hypothetical protein FRB96_008065 [Tulasnella sp. 330]